jgi:arabinan endo-1,5-alpha-L-arabinosidase
MLASMTRSINRRYRFAFGATMKSHLLAVVGLAFISLCAISPALAEDGEPYIHDPSTIMQCAGKYYAFGTGGGGLVSDDGWTWHSGAVRPGGGLAPDVIKLGDRYFVAYASKGGGMNGGHAGAINTMWTKTLDPASTDFGFKDNTVVASTDGIEDADAIDPSFLFAEGRLWLTYGTYFGYIRIVELNPKTAKRIPGNQPVNIAIDMEASAMMYRDGWYYLLGTHGTCCDSANSTYNIRVGRSRKVTGPFLDNMGMDMIRGGGKLFAAASGRHLGPGHFGLMDLGNGVQKFSCHYEADLDRGGRSVLDIRPLMWKDGWPIAGDNFEEGTYEIQSERGGYALELAVDFVRMPNPPRGPGFMRAPTGPVTPIPVQDLAQVLPTWPVGNIDVRLNDYMIRPSQKWTITPVANVGGYPGAPYFKITIAGTDRALAATADAEVVTVPAFSGGPEQLWRIDQSIDGTYRIMPKSMPNSNEPMALTSAGGRTPTLAKFDPKSDKAKWNFRKP